MILPFKFLVLAALHRYPQSTGIAITKTVGSWTCRKERRSQVNTILTRLKEDGYVQGTPMEMERSRRRGGRNTKELMIWEPTESGNAEYLNLAGILGKVIAL